MTLLKRSNGIYYLKFQTENGEKRISTKCRRKSDAKKFLLNFRISLTTPKYTKISLKIIKDEYYEYIGVRYSLGHKKAVISTIEKIMKYTDANFISDLNGNSLERFIAQQISNSIHSANLHYKHLKAFLNWCLNKHYLSANPLSRFKFPRIPQKPNLFIDSKQLDSLVENESNYLLKDIYYFAFHSGLRLGEITNCKWNWINLNERIITITNDKEFSSKNKKSRLIPINDKLFEIICQQKGSETYVFTRVKSIKLTNDYISKNFKKAARKTFGEDTKIHFHNLRGSFGSELIRKGVSTFYVMKLLGHSSLAVTEKNYLGLNVEDLREAVNKLAS